MGAEKVVPREPTPEMICAGIEATFADMCDPGGMARRWQAMFDAAPAQPATAVGEDGPESEDDHACGHGYPRQYRHDCPECSRCQHALKAMGKKWKALCEECGEGPCKRAAHPTPPTLPTARDAGEGELLAIRVEATARHIRACPVYDKLRGDADDMDAAAAFIRQQASAYDALAAERDRAEAARDAAVDLLIRWQRWNDGDDTGLPIEERDMTFDDDTRTFLAHGGFA